MGEIKTLGCFPEDLSSAKNPEIRSNAGLSMEKVYWFSLRTGVRIPAPPQYIMSESAKS